MKKFPKLNVVDESIGWKAIQLAINNAAGCG